MNKNDIEVIDYLTRYAATLTGFDAPATAELWATPGMIVDDRFAGVLVSREAMVQGLEQSYPMYRKVGLASVGYELLAHEQFTERASWNSVYQSPVRARRRDIVMIMEMWTMASWWAGEVS